MITGAHAIVYSTEAEADRAFLRDVLGFGGVDAGGGWLIFELPPAELAVHPAEDEHHELYLMCDDIRATMRELQERGAEFTAEVSDEGFGLLTALRLPSGGTLGLYEPRHPSPLFATKS
jgi:hypothetical protein